MKIIRSVALLLTTVATTAPAVRADSLAPESAALAGAITAAIKPRPTRRGQDLTPSSQLTRDQAQMLAGALSRVNGRDIIVCSVAPTGSMRPYFDENALLLLEAAPFSELKLGDVVTFLHPRLHKLVVHRLVEKRGNVFWSKGDHNGSMDDVYVTPENYQRRLAGVVYMQPGPNAVLRAPVAAAEPN